MQGVRVQVSARERLLRPETRIRHRASDGSVLRRNLKPGTRKTPTLVSCRILNKEYIYECTSRTAH